MNGKPVMASACGTCGTLYSADARGSVGAELCCTCSKCNSPIEATWYLHFDVSSRPRRRDCAVCLARHELSRATAALGEAQDWVAKATAQLDRAVAAAKESA